MMDEAIEELAEEAHEAGDLETAMLLFGVAAAIQNPIHKMQLAELMYIFAVQAKKDLEEWNSLNS